MAKLQTATRQLHRAAVHTAGARPEKAQTERRSGAAVVEMMLQTAIWCAVNAVLDKKREEGESKAARFKREMGEGALLQLKPLELKLSSVASTVQSRQSLGVVASDGQLGHAVLGHHGSVLSASQNKSIVLDLSLKDGVLLLHLSHEPVDAVAVAAFLSHCW